MTGRDIRQSFLDFFKSRQHTVVSSASLMPDSPNLLFTNAGMNQFVPIFLGEQASPFSPGRAADTQKCIRAGGKHNDLEDVGLDTYHHTFFEMLGNWSFGDYFKKEAIDWAWELITEVWKFPKNRLYATVYKPGEGDPASFDQEAYDLWAAKFTEAGLDPAVHVVNGGKKDNFWMMGETGPCGPCSELHVDLTHQGDTGGALVNKDSSECIEIWNLVFIQFNANPDGTFSALPARHVDTGMGFERVSAILQCTKGFTEFGGTISNYETDIFRPIFSELEKLSGHRYKSSMPDRGTSGTTEQQRIDIAFRVIADHIRTLTFAIGDGILPGNTDRNYVLRRILRRAVRYGRTLGFHEPFFYKLVDVLVRSMGEVFPEIEKRRDMIQTTIRTEEVAFNKTLDRGLELFEKEASTLRKGDQFCGEFAFQLYDTYGFPLDLTELMARERGLKVDGKAFETLMEQQRKRAREARKQQVIEVTELGDLPATRFVGFETLVHRTRVSHVVQVKDRVAVLLEETPFYAEMGGQLGDSGELVVHGGGLVISETRKVGDAFLHFIDKGEGDGAPSVGDEVLAQVHAHRRGSIQRHHSVTHLLHWALHEVVSREASQKGSFVGPDKLTFDFNGAALTPSQIQDIEKLVNERILENAPVSWQEVPYAEIRDRSDIMQFFGDKYGDQVRVVQIGGSAGSLDGYSMELCGGTHVRATGEMGCFRILGESAIAAGVRRIEAVAGYPALDVSLETSARLHRIAQSLHVPIEEIERKVEQLKSQQKELEKQVRGLLQSQASARAAQLQGAAESLQEVPAILANLGAEEADFTQAVADALKGRFDGVYVLTSSQDQRVTVIIGASDAWKARFPAGSLMKELAPVVGGKGGGRPEQARGGGSKPASMDALLQTARERLSVAGS